MSYHELGGDYFDRQDTTALRTRLIRKLELLGLKVTVEEIAENGLIATTGKFS